MNAALQRALTVIALAGAFAATERSAASAQVTLGDEGAYDLVGTTSMGRAETIRVSPRAVVREVDAGKLGHDVVIITDAEVVHRAPSGRVDSIVGFSADVDRYLARIISGRQPVRDGPGALPTGEIVAAEVVDGKLVTLRIVTMSTNESVLFTHFAYASGKLVAWDMQATSLQAPVFAEFHGALAPYDRAYVWPATRTGTR